MPIQNVKIIFRNPWSITLFSNLADKFDAHLTFEWIYRHILGNCLKKDLDFKQVVMKTFGSKKLQDLLQIIQDGQISVANGKDVMMRVIDGDQSMPSQIAESLGYIGDALSET